MCFNLTTMPRPLVMLKTLKKSIKKLKKLAYWNTANRFPALNYLNSPDTNQINETNKFHVSLKYIAWLCDKFEGNKKKIGFYLCVLLLIGAGSFLFNESFFCVF